ncbi:MAG: metallophosphoesterase, partial [Candidatus Moraniibacteriota bacterium]
MEKPLFTVAAISDIHVEKYPLSRGFFDHVNGHADILVIGGDMNNGKNDEVRHFLDLVSGVKLPIVIIFGNHDCDTGDIDSVKEMLSTNSRMRILDGEYAEYELGGQKLG